MDERERVRQAVRDWMRRGKITTWKNGDPPPENIWERIKRTIKKIVK